MTRKRPPRTVSGFVLAGGQSSRMGQDKALLKLAGKTLAEHAVLKLRGVCAEVSVLSTQEALAAFAPLVPDPHPGCGPLAGMEAALAHARYDWSLILPVDVPFLPAALLETWVDATLSRADCDGTRLAMHVVDGKPQPALLLLHRDVSGCIAAALERGERKVMPVLRAAAEDLAARRGLPVDKVFWQRAWAVRSAGTGEPVAEGWGQRRDLSEADARLYFANLNTPEDFAEAERNARMLGGLPETK